MARRPPRIQELREKNELNCMWGLLSILESCQGRPSRKLISNGRPVNKHIIDYPRKLDRIASFDEECRKIQNKAGLRRVALDARAASVANFIQEDVPIDKHKSKQDILKRREHAKIDTELDHLVKTQKRARKSSEEAYESSSRCSNNPASLIHQVPSTSADIFLNKLAFAAILEAACGQDQREESKLSEYFQRSIHLGKYDPVDQINIQQVQMRAKAFVDQMLIDRKFICRAGTSSEPKSFSDALEVLNSKKDQSMELLPDPHSLLARRIRNACPQTEKETVKSVLDADFSECEGVDASCSAEPRSAFAMQKGNVNKNLWKKIDYQSQRSAKTKFAAHPSDKIVILKPAPRNVKQAENVSCHCSSLQSHDKLGRRASDAKIASFSFREMKQKLKHTFGVTRKEPSQFPTVGTSDKLSQDRSTLRVGDRCICRGVDIRNSFDSSTNAEKKGKLSKKQDLKSSKNPDIACGTDTSRRKLDFSSVRFSNKQEFDVILEAKRHLSARLKHLNSVEAATSKNSPRTLERILSSPERNFWPFSPRRDSQYCSGSAQMRYSPYNSSAPRVTESSSQMPNGRERACLNPLRSNTEVSSCEDHSRYDSTLQAMDANMSSLIQTTVMEARDTDSTTDNMKTNGESKIVETNSILRRELHAKEEVLSEISSTASSRAMQTTHTIKSQKDDEVVMHSKSESLSENEAYTSIMDDLPSTPSSTSQLDTAESIKYQEEHRSPVSVLEPFFIEDAESPLSVALQTDRKQLQPLRLDFEDCTFESFPQYPSISANSCIEDQDHLSQYVQLLLQASCLNWDQLSEISSQPEELLHASLFDEVSFPHADCYYDPKLLFDHINEVLLDIYSCHFCPPPQLAFTKPKIRPSPLAELVLDEILTEADFYLLPTTERRTLDQLISKDVAKCRSWLDVRLDTEQIITEISEEFLEESMLNVVLELYA